jgi:hypothetical protein
MTSSPAAGRRTPGWKVLLVMIVFIALISTVILVGVQ